MVRTRTQARCGACGNVEPRWVGRCPACGEWGTMGEEVLARSAGGAVGAAGVGAAPQRSAQPIRDVPLDGQLRAPTGVAEFDRVLGGGLVAGSVTLVGGEPGAGKSTLLLQAAHAFAASGRTVLYVCAEESPSQVRLRAERLDALDERLLLAGATELPEVLALMSAHQPALVILDSIQTVRDPQLAGAAGGVGQVRDCAAALAAAAKSHGIACVLVGHVTKDGQLAGPRVLEHLVDTVCDLTGDRHHSLRLLQATKNRFGPVGEVGCFQMTARGLEGIADAGRLFVGDAEDGVTGVVVTMALEGQRPLACEVQALAAPTTLTNPRRVASGFDAARLSLLIAVLDRRARVRLASRDVYVSSVGGLRLTEPAVDLALCLAIASSRRGQPAPRELIAIGEVGLAAEVRMVSHVERRLQEAARLGFRRALVPPAYDGDAFGLQLHRAPDIPTALAVGLVE